MNSATQFQICNNPACIYVTLAKLHRALGKVCPVRLTTKRGLSTSKIPSATDGKATRLGPFTWLERAFSSNGRLVGLLAWVWFCVRFVHTLLAKPLAQEKRL